MITGSINTSLEATLRLTVRGPLGRRGRIAAVIDTGFNGQLTLPLNMITELELPWVQSDEVELGDGSLTECDFYAAVVI